MMYIKAKEAECLEGLVAVENAMMLSERERCEESSKQIARPQVKPVISSQFNRTYSDASQSTIAATS